MKLNESLNKANLGDPAAPENRELDKIAIEARAWYDQNNAFIQREHTGSSNFVGLTSASRHYANRPSDDITRLAWDNFIAADKDYKAMRDWLFSYELFAPSNQIIPRSNVEQ